MEAGGTEWQSLHGGAAKATCSLSASSEGEGEYAVVA